MLLQAARCQGALAAPAPARLRITFFFLALLPGGERSSENKTVPKEKRKKKKKKKRFLQEESPGFHQQPPRPPQNPALLHCRVWGSLTRRGKGMKIKHFSLSAHSSRG